MSKKMLLILLGMSLFLSFTYAIGLLPAKCEGLSYSEDCAQILSDGGLTEAEKKELFANLIVNQGIIPAHEDVRNYNKSKMFAKAPDGVETSSDVTIKDAWFKIISISPSVFDTETGQWNLFSRGKPLMAYSYKIENPKEIPEGDCKEPDYFHNTNEIIDLFLNGEHIFQHASKSKQQNIEADYTTNEKQLNFSARLVVVDELSALHYKWKKVGKNATPICLPDYPIRKEGRYNVRIPDSFYGINDPQDMNILIKKIEREHFDELILGVDINKPINEIILGVDDKEFSFSIAGYDLGYNLSPYDILYLYRTKQENTRYEDMVGLDTSNSKPDFKYYYRTGVIDAPDKCKLTIMTDFEVINKDEECIIKERDEDVVDIIIETDKKEYERKDEAKIKIELKNKKGLPVANERVKVNLGSKTIEVVTDSKGKAYLTTNASEIHGSISARLKDSTKHTKDSPRKPIRVKDEETEKTATDVGKFVGAFYVLGLLAKNVLAGRFRGIML